VIALALRKRPTTRLKVAMHTNLLAKWNRAQEILVRNPFATHFVHLSTFTLLFGFLGG